MPGPADLQAEATDVLRRLVRIDTVNPPGDERVAVEVLAAHLEDAGLDCRTFALDSARPNLVARLRGRRPGPTLTYLGHVDTVPAAPGDWTHDPWSGVVADGCLWGRGTLDMKGQVAAEVTAAAALARAGGRPEAGDLVLVLVADEEAGGRYGARFLTEEHPEEVRCDFLVNEGGGQVIDHAGRRIYPVAVAEKGAFRFTVTTRGDEGDPDAGAAILQLGPLLSRLARGEQAAGADTPAEVTELLRALGEPGDAAAALERLRRQAPRLAGLVETMARTTVAPTRASAAGDTASVDVDCRAAPGADEAAVRAQIAAMLGPGDHQVTFHPPRRGTRSPARSPLMAAIRSWVTRTDPGSLAVPIIDPGITDAHWFRKAFPACTAYGFFPQPHTPHLRYKELIHAADERIDLRDLGIATSFFAALPQALLGWSAPVRQRTVSVPA